MLVLPRPLRCHFGTISAVPVASFLSASLRCSTASATVNIASSSIYAASAAAAAISPRCCRAPASQSGVDCHACYLQCTPSLNFRAAASLSSAILRLATASSTTNVTSNTVSAPSAATVAVALHCLCAPDSAPGIDCRDCYCHETPQLL